MELLAIPISWITILLFTVFVIFINKKSKRGRLPPGPSSFPVVGNLFLLRTRPYEKLTSLAGRYGPVMSLKIGSVFTVVISSSVVAKRALTLHADVFSEQFVIDAVYSNGHDHLSAGWLPSSSPQWRSLRRLYGTLFSGPKLESTLEGRRVAVANLVDRLRVHSNDGLSVVDVGELVLHAFFEIMFNTVFFRDAPSLGGHKTKEIEQLMVAIVKEIEEPNVADCFPILHWMDPQGIRRRLTLLCSKLFKAFDDIIDQRLKTRSKCKASERTTEDALDMVLDAMDEQKGITRQNVLHMFLDIMGPGMDTSSKVVEWTMAELLNNPEALHKAKQEIHEAVGSGKVVNESDICSLPYTQAAVKESFRLHPPSPFLIPRRAKRDVQLQGYTIPKGSRLMVNLWAMGRDPNVWESAHSFTPERFLDNSKPQGLELIPFGGGRRSCPGTQLATRSVITVVASLINCFNWKLEDEGGVDMQPEFGITLKKLHPLRAIPVHRL